MTPKLHPLEPRTQAPGGRVYPPNPLPVPATPASGWGRHGLSPPLRRWPRREAGQVPRALPKAPKSKTIVTQGELRQVGLRLSSATPFPQPRLGFLPTRRTKPAPVAAAASGVQSRAEGGGRARSFVRWDSAGRSRAAGQPRLSEPPRKAPLRAAHGAHLAVQLPPTPLCSGRTHHTRHPEPVSSESRELRREAGRRVLGGDSWSGS